MKTRFPPKPRKPPNVAVRPVIRPLGMPTTTRSTLPDGPLPLVRTGQPRRFPVVMLMSGLASAVVTAEVAGGSVGVGVG